MEVTSKSMYSSGTSLETNNLLTVEEIEERIQQLITENTGLRSMYSYLFLTYISNILYPFCCRYIATKQYIHETTFFDIGGMAGGGYKGAKCLSKQS